MRRSPRTRLFAASVAMVATLGLAACGDDDDDTASTVDVDVTLDTDVTDVTVTDDTDVSDTIDTIAPDDTSDGSTPSSGSGEVGSQDDYIEAAKDEIGSEFDDQDVADCVGEAMVNDDVYAAIQDEGLTVEQFREDGPTGLTVDDSVAADVAADFGECGDLLSEIAADEDELGCVEGNMTNDQMAEFLAYTLLGREPSAEVASAYDDIETCVTESTTATT